MMASVHKPEEEVRLKFSTRGGVNLHLGWDTALFQSQDHLALKMIPNYIKITRSSRDKKFSISVPRDQEVNCIKALGRVSFFFLLDYPCHACVNLAPVKTAEKALRVSLLIVFWEDFGTPTLHLTNAIRPNIITWIVDGPPAIITGKIPTSPGERLSELIERNISTGNKRK